MREYPILITGMYRSGTTYLSQIIGANSQINMTYDSVNYFRYIVKKSIPPSEYLMIVNSIAERMETRYNIILNEKRIIENIERLNNLKNHANIYSCIMDDLFSYSKKRWCEKALLEWTSIPLFLSMFENSKCIHIIRDPRDVLASYKNMTIEEGYRYLDSVFASLSSLKSATKHYSIIPSNKLLITRYENLVSNTAEEVSKICDFLEIRNEKNMLNLNQYKTIDGKPFKFKNHTSFPDSTKRPIGQWKNKLEKFEVELTEAVVGEQMEEWGYNASIDFDGNSIEKILGVIKVTPLLAERIKVLLETGDGVESYPSDPTDSRNWGSDSGIKGKGASAAYGKLH